MGELTFARPRPLAADDVLEEFSCGVTSIDMWLQTYAHNAKKNGTAVVYVVYSSEGSLAAFYTLSSQSMIRSDASGWIARNAPGQIPVILLGMLGIDKKYQGLGLGKQVLLDAIHRVLGISEQIGARALVVDPVDENAKNFYLHFGFKEIKGTERLFAKLA